MNDFSQQRGEHQSKDLQGAEAIQKIKDLVSQAPGCFFCSNIKTGLPFSARPMSVQRVDDEGNFWFLSPKDSHKNDELETDPFVQLLFEESAHSDFMTIYGIASISNDSKKIKELWEPVMKAWFAGGQDDPNISVIKVEPTEGYYWDNKYGKAIGFVKQDSGDANETSADTTEGKLEVVDSEND